MTTGDGGDLSPMLPQPSDDNAPMISGRGTKIIADARGAYLAGNLDALLERMDEAQQLHFRQAIVRQTLSAVERTNSRLQLEWVERCIHIAREWLVVPSSDGALALSNVLVEQGVIDLDDDYEVVDDTNSNTFDLYWCMTEPLLEASFGAAFAVLTCADLLGSDSVHAGEIASQWQLDAAWNILQGKEPPPFELPS